MNLRKFAEWLAIAFLGCLVATVFQQIHSSMSAQGIASGSPYDNAAAYPKAVAILIFCLALSLIARLLFQAEMARPQSRKIRLVRSSGLLAVFMAYLLALGSVGYHLSTPPMLVVTLLLAGHRNLFSASVFALLVSVSFAFFFEVFLKIVLPGGFWGLNIPWQMN